MLNSSSQEVATSRASSWAQFVEVNRRRRAIREFSDCPVPDADIEAVCAQALLAPSSFNVQPYELHWVRGPALKQALVKACRGQRAAGTASTLLVVSVGPRVARATAAAQRAHLASDTDPAAPRRLARASNIARLTSVLSWPLWAPLHSLLGLLLPSLALLPLGSVAAKSWYARSALLAAQTLMLAASARGLDTCPMEGFNPEAVRRHLRLPYGTAVPLVIAVGYRAAHCVREAQWRRPLSQVLRVHDDG